MRRGTHHETCLARNSDCPRVCGGGLRRRDGRISCDARCIPHNARRLVSRSPVPKTCLLASSGTWQIASMNFLTGDLGWIMARDIAPNGALTAEAVCRTRDGGTHWTPLAAFNAQTPVPGPQSEGPGLIPISQLNFQSPAQGNAVVSLGAGACQAGYAVLATPDGGAYGTQSTLPSQGLSNNITQLSFTSPHQGWVVTAQQNQPFHVYALSGTGWTAMATPDSSANTPPLADRVSGRIGYLAQNTSQGISLFKTVDGGQEWIPLTFPSR